MRDRSDPRSERAGAHVKLSIKDSVKLFKRLKDTDTETLLVLCFVFNKITLLLFEGLLP